MNYKLIVVSIFLLVSGIIIYFSFFLPVPSFAPESQLLKKLEVHNVTISWYKRIGILDQEFPTYLILHRNNVKDTICQAYNIADLKMKEGQIVVSFYGSPKYANSTKLSNKVMDFDILTDTSSVLSRK